VSDELDLINAAKAGSVDAFTELVRSYRERLLRFLLTRCDSYADAEDALQDTFINAYRYLHTYDSQWRFSTWLYRIAIRNAGKLRTSHVTDLGELRDDESDPLNQCIADSERENLWQSARRLLSDEVYSAMWLRYVEDMSINDVAAVLKRSNSWTKVNLMRGRRTLDAELNRGGPAKESEAYG
jgi:RNA polymerase sigma-70 factor (ECF subfamily)